MSKPQDNNGDRPIPPNQELLAGFEQLPTSQKLDLFEETMCLLSDDLTKLDDPVLDRELDILDGIHTNIRTRLDEIAAIYGSLK